MIQYVQNIFNECRYRNKSFFYCLIRAVDRFIAVGWYYYKKYILYPVLRKKSMRRVFTDVVFREACFEIVKNCPCVSLDHVKDDEVRSTILRYADDICTHTFTILSSTIVCGSRIDWHRDYTAGYTWNPDTFYADIKIPYGEAEIKAPWELSRFHHALMLGQAYAITHDERYAQEFVSQVSDWINRNAFGHGVNWASPMEVAIRACNWSSAFFYIKDSPSLTKEFLLKFFSSLYDHGVHIRTNLERTRYVRGNHYLANIVGLLCISSIYKNFIVFSQWNSFAKKELVRAMQEQVYEDGCDFEASTYYHCFSLELFFHATRIAVESEMSHENQCNYRVVAEKIFGNDYVKKLYSMFTALKYLMKPNGQIPQIGDADNGHLFVYYPHTMLDMRPLLAMGAMFFQEPRFKIYEFGYSPEVQLVFGGNGLKQWNIVSSTSSKEIGSKAFPNTGWYVMRRDKNYCIISCGQNGQNGYGGHAHNDKLSFELMIDGEDVIIDPGTFIYTRDPKIRNEFRSTRNHNTVVIDGNEQKDFHHSNVFMLPDTIHAKVLTWEENEEEDYFCGEHRGYEGCVDLVTHRREFLFSKKDGVLTITDSFLGEGQHTIEWNFIIVPDAQPHITIVSPDVSFSINPARYSPSYGIETKTMRYLAKKIVVLPYHARLNLSFHSPQRAL